jgi:hypothetical protein
MIPYPKASHSHPAPEAFANCARSDNPDEALSWRRPMFGLLMMSVPLGIAVSLSTVALVWTESDRSAGGEEDISARRPHDRR